jgi:F-type H+-transporting ATPase subunit c
MRKSTLFVMVIAMLFIASPVFAQVSGADATAAAKAWAIPIGASIGMGLAAGIAGLGQGRIAGSAAEALARNPGARPAIQLALILGLAFVESLVLFTFVMIFLKAA